MRKLIETVRAVAFDLDGTLVDTMPDLVAAVNVMLITLGGHELPESRVRALVGEGVDQLVLRAVTESLGGSRPPIPMQISAGAALFRKLYAQNLFQHSKLYPGVIQTLRSLQEAGMGLCCITNKDSAFAIPLLELAGLRDYLTFTLCADRVEDRKPSPRLLLEACARLGLAPADVLYVGDTLVDIQAARAARCNVVAVTYGYHRGAPRQDTRPDACIDSLPELLSLRAQSSQASDELSGRRELSATLR